MSIGRHIVDLVPLMLVVLHIQMLFGKGKLFEIIDIFLQTHVLLLHQIGMGLSDIPQMPRLVIDLGNGGLFLGIADDESIAMGVLPNPSIFPRTVKLIVDASIVGNAKIQGVSGMVFAGARPLYVAIRFLLAVLSHLILIEPLLIRISTISADDSHIIPMGIRIEILHKCIPGCADMRVDGNKLVLHLITVVLLGIDGGLFGLMGKVKGMICIDEDQVALTDILSGLGDDIIF